MSPAAGIEGDHCFYYYLHCYCHSMITVIAVTITPTQTGNGSPKRHIYSVPAKHVTGSLTSQGLFGMYRDQERAQPCTFLGLQDQVRVAICTCKKRLERPIPQPPSRSKHMPSPRQQFYPEPASCLAPWVFRFRVGGRRFTASG